MKCRCLFCGAATDDEGLAHVEELGELTRGEGVGAVDELAELTDGEDVGTVAKLADLHGGGGGYNAEDGNGGPGDDDGTGCVVMLPFTGGAAPDVWIDEAVPTNNIRIMAACPLTWALPLAPAHGLSAPHSPFIGVPSPLPPPLPTH